MLLGVTLGSKLGAELGAALTVLIALLGSGVATSLEVVAGLSGGVDCCACGTEGCLDSELAGTVVLV